MQPSERAKDRGRRDDAFGLGVGEIAASELCGNGGGHPVHRPPRPDLVYLFCSLEVTHSVVSSVSHASLRLNALKYLA